MRKNRINELLEMHNGMLPGVFTSNTLSTISSNKHDKLGNQDMKKENKRFAPNKVSFNQWLQSTLKDEELDDEELDDEELNDEELNDENDVEELDFNDDSQRDFGDDFNDETDDEFADDEFADDEFADDEFADDEFADDEFAFNKYPDEELDEFADEEEEEFDIKNGFDQNREETDDFEDVATKMVDNISDEVIEKIDASTGSISKWWREVVVPNKYKKKLTVDNTEIVDSFPNEFEEEEEAGPTKIDRARLIYQRMVIQPNMTRSDIIAAFISNADVTHSTAVSYYERIAKEMEHTGPGGSEEVETGGEFGTDPEEQTPEQADDFDEPEMGAEEVDTSGPPDRRGIIRTVQNAHLVYKRQSEEGTFEELWSYNVGSNMKDDLKTRRAILAGTDIPQNKTQSEDGTQSYSLTTMGNAQLLHIRGLSN